MKKKVVPTLRQEVKVKVDIVTSDDIKIYYTEKFQDFTARYRINTYNTDPCLTRLSLFTSKSFQSEYHIDGSVQYYPKCLYKV